MRRVRFLVTAAVLPVLLTAACSDRPNDLYQYYDDPTSDVPTTARPSAPPSSSAPRQAPSTTAKPVDLTPVALSATDLAAEQVTADGVEPRFPVRLTDCSAPLKPTDNGTTARWKYATGSVLTQSVAAYPTSAASVVATLRDHLVCGFFLVDTQRFTMEGGADVTLPGTDAQVSWCATGPKRSTCSVAVAVGRHLTVLSVEAAGTPRARSAITRLAPLAAAKLAQD
ncbi:hypothetical protein [Actinokineospora sp. HUAS TT18]|uniref:hypothetical protein n=1 Tax=Actinokineospora sp. HUAS TT18 TaxID=3447451 RepID=UPI003F52094A